MPSFEDVPAALLLLAADGRIARTNGRGRALFGGDVTGLPADAVVATYGPGERVGVDALLGRADRAMYAAKRAGRGLAVLAGADAQAISDAARCPERTAPSM